MVISVIAGPTASGKSLHALNIPNAEIINADSLQLYKDLRILTARPEDKNHHHLYGILDYSEQINAHQWCMLAYQKIDEILKNKKTPVVVGGTGFYIRALTEGLSPIPEIDPNIKQTIYDMSLEELKKAATPEILSHFKDKQRIQRALAVEKSTGKTIFEWQAIKPVPPPYDFKIQLIMLERSVLYERINKRFDQMISEGAIDEVKKLLAIDQNVLETPIARAIGVKELANYLNGVWTLEKAVEISKIKTRQYAKRQVTWFKMYCK